MIAPDVIKCYQMTIDTVHRACDLKPLCFSNISSCLIIINHNHHQIDKYTLSRKHNIPFENVFLRNLLCVRLMKLIKEEI